MGGSRHVRLRVGVIGLGRLWETRHKPSLARLDDRFRVTAVYDPVFRRAELEATQIGCAACEGLAALVERSDVDVIYLLSRQWFGLHPIGLACAAGKPVYCALPLADDLAELDMLAKLVEQSGIVFMPEFARRCYPGDLATQGTAGDPVGPAAPGCGTHPALWIRPLCDPGPHNPDRSGPARDRSRQLLDRLVLLCLSVDPRRDTRVSVPGDFLAQITRTRTPISRASWRLLPGARRPRSHMADTTVHRGATRAASCRRLAFRSSPSAGRPGWKCPRRSSGRMRPVPRKNGSRSSQPLATCSTTSSTALSEAIIRSRRRFATALDIARLVNELRRGQRERPNVARATT